MKGTVNVKETNPSTDHHNQMLSLMCTKITENFSTVKKDLMLKILISKQYTFTNRHLLFNYSYSN